MNDDTSNSITPPGNWRTGQQYGDYAPGNNNQSLMRSMFVRSLPFRATSNVSREVRDPWWPSEERSMIQSNRLASFQAPRHSPAAREGMATPRQSMLELSPMFLGQWNTQLPTYEEESRLSYDEQKKALMKLRKEIYNPPPKMATRQAWLHSRWNARNSSTENEKVNDEDGKRCSICLEDFEPRQMVMLTPCNHMFHEDCIVPWVKSHGQCPVCRFAMYEQRRVIAVTTNDRRANVAPNDPFARELLSVIINFEEAIEWMNQRTFR
ncbi:unnamed protein product [Ilex paraguariensis]|uniref:RING-type domain-containing protein n=1 Tax=Ilex paraguariensis TaxID=185542 RepID=A0ABC8RX62_9AQUA